MWILLRRLMTVERIFSCEFSSGKVLMCHKESLWTQNRIGARKDTLVLQDTPACVWWGTDQQDHSPPWNIWLRRILCPNLLLIQQPPGAGTSKRKPKPALGLPRIQWLTVAIPQLCRVNIPQEHFPEEHSTGTFPTGTFHCCPLKLPLIPLVLPLPADSGITPHPLGSGHLHTE